MKNIHPIIVVDDDLDDCELIQSAFSDIGIANEIIFFANGAEALAYLKSTQEPTFLIFSDVNMPCMNGLQLKEEINKDSYLRRFSIPFVFLSTSNTAREVEAAYDLLAQGYFKKPNSYKEIKAILKMVTDYWNTCKHPKSN